MISITFFLFSALAAAAVGLLRSRWLEMAPDLARIPARDLPVSTRIAPAAGSDQRKAA